MLSAVIPSIRSYPAFTFGKITGTPEVCPSRSSRTREKSSQGLGCSPIKAVRELGSERRETVWSISAIGVGSLRGSVPSTRGPEWTHLWCTSYLAKGKRWVAKCGRDNR